MPWTIFLKNLTKPVQELTAHFIITVYALILITAVEAILEYLHLEHRIVPLLGISLSDWMFDMDVISVSLVLFVGLAKALREMW